MSTTELVGNNKNGVGGFGDRPEDINKGGRPKNSLKSYVALKLAKMSDEQKDEYISEMNKENVWKMAEGSPHQTQDTTIEVTLPEPLLAGKSHVKPNNNSNKQATETDKKD